MGVRARACVLCVYWAGRAGLLLVRSEWSVVVRLTLTLNYLCRRNESRGSVVDKDSRKETMAQLCLAAEGIVSPDTHAVCGSAWPAPDYDTES